ncbi:MAG: PKD domain-containing protein, partial [Flavobacteriales bacterium]|nr:PKD domain-containing protein [Flavobacteriales bacterium]MDW8409056.1 PKD domain-containing protein [Flavobacteriales bacterium]
GQIGYTWNTTPVQTTATATNLSQGTYTVTATDANGCQASATVQIMQPSPLQVAITNISHVSCFGLSNGTATAVASGGVGSYSYSWNTTPPQNAATATGLGAGTYSVMVTDGNGCQNGVSIQITQPSQLTVSVNAQNASCHGTNTGSIQATAQGGTPNYTYSWNNGALMGPSHSNLPAGTYNVLVTDANGCTASAQGTISQPAPLAVSITNVQHVSCFGANDGSATAVPSGGPGGYLYLWLPGGQTTPTVSGLGPATYTVYVADNLLCDTVSATVTINEPPPVTLSLSASPGTEVCSGTAVTLSASGAQDYTWNPGALQGSSIQVAIVNNTTYDVIGTDANGCIGIGSITLTVLPNPVASLQASPPEVCAGQVLTLDASGSTTPSPGSVTAVDWDMDNNNIFEITNGGFTQSVNTSTPGTYTVQAMVTNSDGCKDIQAVTYTVNPVPVAAFSAANVCDGTALNFNNQSSMTPGGTLNYQWDFGAGGTGSTQPSPSYTYPGPGSYPVTLTVTSDKGCISQAYDTVQVYPNPPVAFTVQPQCFHVVDVSVTDPQNDLSYMWDFGDQSSATETIYQHTYEQAGTYTITLTATNAFGCQSSTSQNVDVIKSVPLSQVQLPNIITPNGDGLNDRLLIDPNFEQCTEYEVLIFNRWGNLVYRYTQNGTPFEGKNKGGTRLQPGVYFYVIRSGTLEKNSSLTIVQ